MDSSEVGRYGTISFMKRLEPDSVVATFPIDDDQVTFGRDPHCSVRLYYNSVSSVHCKIIFQEYKAFLVVLGANGVLVDGCQVFPSSSPTLHTTIPLGNNSEIEIHGKRFRFSYPPKELRAALIASPRNHVAGTPYRKRALRLSMIQSAQVFSPRPTRSAFQNLRILQSPLKPFKTPSKVNNLVINPQDPDEQEVVLVDGDCPRVLEEEKDLIILEDVEVDADILPDEQQRTPTQHSYGANPSMVPSTPTNVPRVSFPPAVPQPFQTPRRRVTGASLHRAVLIRSAQRAVIKAEIAKEEEDEENEVEGAIATDVATVSSQSSEDEIEEEEEMEEKEEKEVPQKSVSTWRKSLEAVKIWPFSSATPNPEHEHEDHESDIADVDLVDEQNQDADSPMQSNDAMPDPIVDGDEEQFQYPSNATPNQRRILGSFMTPQANRKTVGGGRYSSGAVGLAGEARRVTMDQTWRVNDLVVPERSTYGGIKEEEEEEDEKRDVGGLDMERQRQRLSDEERKAIRDRRRSALTTPDTFFGGQAPGMRRMSGVHASGGVFASPTKSVTPLSPVKMPEMQGKEDLDTRSLLERMKETVEGMKKRRESVGPRLSLGIGMSPTKRSGQGESGFGSFSLLASEVTEEDGDSWRLGGDHMDVDVEPRQKEEDVSDRLAAAFPNNIRPDQANLMDAVPSIHTPRKTPKNVLNNMSTTSKAPATPTFKDTKIMFAEPRIARTPVFEGIGEMLKTPDGYWGVRDEADAEMEEVAPVKKASRTKATSTRVPASSRQKKTQPKVAVESVAEEETPEIQGDVVAKGGRRGRSRSKQPESDIENGGDDGNVAKPKARNLRGTSKKAVPSIAEEPILVPEPEMPSRSDGSNATDESAAPSQNTASKAKPPSKKRKDIVQVKSEEVNEEAPAAPKLATRRNRKAAESEPSPPTEETPPNAPTKPARKPRAPKSQETPSAPEPEVPATRKVRVRSKVQSTDDEAPKESGGAPGRRAMRGKAVEVEVDGDDDPLDTIRGNETEVREDVVPATKARRGVRGKADKIEVVREEARDSGDVASAVLSDTSAGKKTSSAKAPAKPANGGTGTRSSARVKKVTTVGTSIDVMDKENTPGSGAMDAEEQEEEKAVKIRVSRTKKAPAAKEKLAEVDAVPEVTATRATRKTRK